jgi:hypothetical protein
MAQLPKEVKEAISEQDVFPVATCNLEGMPNVVYIKYLKIIDDETILIADNFLNKTRSNILSNPRVAFVVSDEEKGSFQVKGSIKRLTDGPMFEEVQRWVPNNLPRKAAVVLKVEEVYNGAKRLV